ncbi:hypothetical protein [Nocardia salmonicida]|uniref:hypothetical protein n=1 Tax=Nocardia salmonicida TaxID=53431 RepID=UPI0007A4FE2E|nr:hypothetical protein [Nocardia salmonicida]
MFDEARYERVLTRIAADPDIEIGELCAKVTPQRWFTDHGGWTAWDGDPYPHLDAWAADDPLAEAISNSKLIAEAERLLRAITDPARVQDWESWDPGGSPEVAANAMRALIRHLRNRPADYTEIADWIYNDIDHNTEISEREAKTIAAGWVSDLYCPDLHAWIGGRDVAAGALVAEARELWSDLATCVIDWPHEGEPEPSIAAVAALTAFLKARTL